MTLNRRIFFTFFPIFLLLLSGSVLSYFSFLVFRTEQRVLYRENLILNQLVHQYEQTKIPYISYLEFKKFEDLDSYLRESAQLKERMLELEDQVQGDEVSLILRDILGMMESYLIISDKAVVLKRNRLIAEYYREYLKSLEVDQFIDEFTGKYNNALLQKNAQRYQSLEKRISSLQRFFILLISILSIFSLWLMNYLSATISRPVRDLTRRAFLIAEGDFRTKPVVGSSASDELKELSRTFNVMSERIRENLGLKDALHMEELKNLKMRESASQAEFFALQSQINPHFMFNTLNAGVQLSMFEKAEKTEEFLNTFSRFLRYCLRGMQEPVRVEEEMNSISLYLELMRIRYGDIFQVVIKGAPKRQDWMLPRTILQPLIENVFVHALQSGEDIRIEIDLEERPGQLLIGISDNGPGFSEEEIRRINSFGDLDFDELAELTRGKIGLVNVYFRLFLFFGEGFEMYAEEGPGATVRLAIPAGDGYEDSDS